jgi:hypothetical protein
MTAASGGSQAAWRRDQQLLAQRRQQAEDRLARERARNSRIALAGFVSLAVVLGVGIHMGWAPAGLGARLSPPDADAKQFAETRTGHVRFTSLDGAICRELLFNNDTGKFSDGKLVRCDGAAADAEAPPAEPSSRALSIRDGFMKR